MLPNIDFDEKIAMQETRPLQFEMMCKKKMYWLNSDIGKSDVPEPEKKEEKEEESEQEALEKK